MEIGVYSKIDFINPRFGEVKEIFKDVLEDRYSSIKVFKRPGNNNFKKLEAGDLVEGFIDVDTFIKGFYAPLEENGSTTDIANYTVLEKHEFNL